MSRLRGVIDMGPEGPHDPRLHVFRCSPVGHLQELPMTAVVLVVGLLGVAVIMSSKPTSAANLSPSAIRPSIVTVTREVAAPIVRGRVHRRAVAYPTRSASVRRTLGMPCVLPPDVIVQQNWNGPQCRWIDNVIPGDERLWIKIRRFDLGLAGSM
jgi:hypothetical protein